MNFYTFRTVPLSIIRSVSLYTQKWYTSWRFAESLQAGSGWNSVPSWSCLQAPGILIHAVFDLQLLRKQYDTLRRRRLSRFCIRTIFLFQSSYFVRSVSYRSMMVLLYLKKILLLPCVILERNLKIPNYMKDFIHV
jgi:hypothetical protein